ncbi:alpha-galactosidase [Erythrobacter sp. WG]|uniref:alpha-galactosidase n=1 Tax=Erythrobacter sp. WG TaxID=2985510 RepID=UPI002270708E|nr:alpha-galactosidase [Erythrobacter sp. WG]MCX9146080.1 alpha-galactosidase [Erythrobacter sp. WG]
MELLRLDGERLTLVLALEESGAADLAYIGPRLPGDEDLAMIAAAGARGRHESQPDSPPRPGLFPERKGGWNGTPAVVLRRAGRRVETDLRIAAWERAERALAIRFADRLAGVEVLLRWRFGAGDVVTSAVTIANTGEAPLAVERCAALALPVPARFAEVTAFAGRWAAEMREHRRPIRPEGLHREGAAGKPGFDGAGWVLLHAGDETLGAHLAWSGDAWLTLDADPPGGADGRAQLVTGAALNPGEVVLAPGETFDTPEAVLALAPDRSALAQAFHAHVRAEVLPERATWGPRKVHLNSWEALGFDLSEPALIALAESAAALGAERFVLDDGWFGGRRSDRTSLGDWTVSPEVFPNGLAPLIARVHALGMDFGLWVEPEMVSPDSDLYRAHPDWCLHTPGRERPTMRGQLALDMARGEVRDYLFARLDALLRKHPIAYLKWDHNRDLFPAAPGQTEGFYALLDALRAAHPHVEIESCASGGGRIDFGVLQRTCRVWPSDNNDAIERLRIIPAWSQFLPLEVLGSHVGPSPNPITGRRLAMDFRAKVAMFGHMGVEADPARMTGRERETLAAHIALYKAWRPVLHSGDLHRLAHPDPAVTAMMVTHEGRALVLVAQTAFSSMFDAAPIRLAGLDPAARYRVRLPEPWPPRAQHYLADPDLWREGLVLSGAALMTHGLALPLTHPETAWLVALERLAP